MNNKQKVEEYAAKTGIQLIAEERQRQIEVEGFNENHDAQYEARELLRAAHCYMIADLNYYKNSIVPTWPWPIEWWKPSPDNRIRELQKAGALIAAEIDRIQAINPSPEKPSEL